MITNQLMIPINATPVIMARTSCFLLCCSRNLAPCTGYTAISLTVDHL